MKKSLIVILLITGSFIGTILACGSPTQLVTINLNEDQTDQILDESGGSFKGKDWIFMYDRVDLQEGLMRVHGSFEYEEGPAVNGYLDSGFSVVDGSLQAELLTANFGDFHPVESDLLLLTESFEQVIKDAVEGDRNAVQYVAVEMIDDLMKIQFRFLP